MLPKKCPQEGTQPQRTPEEPPVTDGAFRGINILHWLKSAADLMVDSIVRFRELIIISHSSWKGWNISVSHRISRSSIDTDVSQVFLHAAITLRCDQNRIRVWNQTSGRLAWFCWQWTGSFCVWDMRLIVHCQHYRNKAARITVRVM